MYSVIEGKGEATIGAETFRFEPKDVFVVPSWSALSLKASEECVLFSFSDRPGQEAMGLWREQRA